MDTLGFVGFGAMAQRMAARLAERGHALVATDPHHTGGEVGGARMLASPRAVAEAADVILISVPADPALAEVAGSAEGILEGGRPGQLVIDLSSVSPDASRKFAADCAARGLRAIDAPVSGSTPEAEKGELVVLAGGSADDIAAAAPILDAIGKKTIHAGPAGQGSALKLAVNAIMGLGLAAVAEAVSYGLAAGLDRDMLFEALAGLAVVSPHHARKLRTAKEGDFAPQFPTRLMSKDLQLVLADAARHAVPMPATAVAAQLFALALRDHADDDYSAAIGVATGHVTG